MKRRWGWGETDGGRVNVLEVRTSPPLTTEISSNHSPPVQTVSGEESPASGKEDGTAEWVSHCHFGTIFGFRRNRVATAREKAEIIFSRL